MNEFGVLFKFPKTDRISKDSKSEEIRELAKLLEKRPISLFARSISVRMVDCGSSNDIETEEGLANSPQVDCERFGIHFTASPRHADVLLASGPVSVNMKRALEKTYAAMPSPKAVVAAGDGAVSGGLFSKSGAVFRQGRIQDVIPVAINIPGNPPSPYALILGILKAGMLLSKSKK